MKFFAKNILKKQISVESLLKMLLGIGLCIFIVVILLPVFKKMSAHDRDHAVRTSMNGRLSAAVLFIERHVADTGSLPEDEAVAREYAAIFQGKLPFLKLRYMAGKEKNSYIVYVFNEESRQTVIYNSTTGRE